MEKRSVNTKKKYYIGDYLAWCGALGLYLATVDDVRSILHELVDHGRVRVGDEAETARAARLRVLHDHVVDELAELGEVGLERLVVGFVAEATDEHLAELLGLHLAVVGRVAAAVVAGARVAGVRHTGAIIVLAVALVVVIVGASIGGDHVAVLVVGRAVLVICLVIAVVVADVVGVWVVLAIVVAIAVAIVSVDVIAVAIRLAEAVRVDVVGELRVRVDFVCDVGLEFGLHRVLVLVACLVCHYCYSPVLCCSFLSFCLVIIF